MTRLLFLFLFPLALWSDPWGRDADLASRQNNQKKCCSTTPLGKIGVSLIRFHQEVISPIDGPRSHYIPSSSQYTLDAICEYGFFTGVMLGCDRLLRENKEEWVYPTVPRDCRSRLKWDPVDGHCRPDMLPAGAIAIIEDD